MLQVPLQSFLVPSGTKGPSTRQPFITKLWLPNDPQIILGTFPLDQILYFLCTDVADPFGGRSTDSAWIVKFFKHTEMYLSSLLCGSIGLCDSVVLSSRDWTCLTVWSHDYLEIHSLLPFPPIS